MSDVNGDDDGRRSDQTENRRVNLPITDRSPDLLARIGASRIQRMAYPCHLCEYGEAARKAPIQSCILRVAWRMTA